MTTTRRQLRAGTAAGSGTTVVPAQLVRFDAADWPPTAEEPDPQLEIVAGDPNARAWGRFFARRRWYEAQRRWCAENDMTTSELWRLIWPPDRRMRG